MNLEIDKELCVCAMDWQKWTKLMQILKETGNDWRERWLVSQMRMDQSVKNTIRTSGDKKCEVWKRSYKKILFVTDFITRIQ
jgi:hypothetical protein